jgi:hypothetical protein
MTARPPFEATFPESSDAFRDVTSIFPFSAGDVDRLQATLANPPELTMQRGIVELREHGRAGDMLTTLYGAQFDAWHMDHGRLPTDSPEDSLVYKIAQLYGLRLASDRYYSLTDQRMRPSSLEAYDKAREAVLNSYDVRQAPFPLNDWEIETWRESIHGGSPFLSAALGFAYEQLMEHYGQLFDKALSLPEQRIYFALYRGMVDSAIFFNTYLRASHGLDVEQFEGLTFRELGVDPASLAVGETGYYFPEGPGTYRNMDLMQGEDLEMFFARVSWPDYEVTMTVGGREFSAQRFITQVDPHHYRVGYRITALTEDLPAISRSNFQRTVGLMGAASMGGMILGGALEALTSTATGQSIAEAASAGTVAGLVVGAVAGVVRAINRRRKV